MSELIKLTDLQLGWIAGFLEGEGYFFVKGGKYPGVAVASVDEDSLTKLQSYIKLGNVGGPYKPKTKNSSPYWQYRLHGKGAFELMTVIQPLMARRRADTITGIIEASKDVKFNKVKTLKLEEIS